jgi:hypothetical protein
MTSEGNEPNHENDLYSRLYIDAHLCRPQCGDLGQVNSETGKGNSSELVECKSTTN